MDLNQLKAQAAAAASRIEENAAKAAAALNSPEFKSYVETLRNPPKLGGADKAPNLQAYAQMLYSKSKENVIRNIAEHALNALGVGKSENARTAKIDVIIGKLKQYVPNPQELARYGSKFYKSTEEQKRVCDVFADAINKQYGGVIISASAPLGERCKQISEVLHSLIAGMNSEFMGVAADVNRILNNINVVGEVLDSTYNKILDFLEKSDDDELKQYSKNYRQLYAEVKAEFDRQQAVLANLMNNTITPAKGEIVKLLQDNPDFRGLVDNLEQQIGTDGFGRKLASLVSNASGVVYAAEQVDKAMKKIGLSLEQLKSAKDMKDLHAKVIKSIMAKKPDSEELNDMMKAVKVLFENSYNQNEIIEQLSKSKRGGRMEPGSDPTSPRDPSSPVESSTGSDESEASGSESEQPLNLELKEGGAVITADNDEEDSKNLPLFFRKQSIKRKISDKEKQRKIMFSQFRTLLRDTYNNIVRHAERLGPLVGNEIPVSDELEKFINLFGELPALDKENIHIALTGYPRDLKSREKRENFLNEYALVAQSLEPLVSGPHGSTLAGLKSSIEEMIKVVDNFTQTMVKPLTEIHVDSPQEILEKVRNMAAKIYTGSGPGVREPFMMGDWTTFNRIKNELRYFYNISIIKKNMAQRALDNQAYAEDYIRVLGEESGWLINKITSEFNDLIQNGNPDAPPTAKAPGAPPTLGEQIGAHLKTLGDDGKKVYKNLKLIWNNQLAAKVGMVKAGQAVDLYLKAFTRGIAKDPDSVKSIAAMLDGVQFVAKWFVERSGDNLASLLSVADDPKKILGSEKGVLLNKDSEHYYEVVAGQNPGVPSNGIDLAKITEKEVENLMKFTDKTLKSTRALENILSVFTSVGDKFKDIQPSSETFMNSGQLQNALIDYMRVAAFSTYNVAGGSLDQVAFATIPNNSVGFWVYHAWDRRNVVGSQRQDIAGWQDAFYDTDMLFLMTIKGIVAKIFTVVDAYRLFNRPTTNRLLSSSLSPVRTVMGGGAGVKIIPEALELYFRLPLLAEWYRDKFGFNAIDEQRAAGAADDDEWVLALVPNIDGIWSDLFAVIFDRARQIKEGNYTESQARDIIEAINTCFKAYRGKYPKASCRDIIHAFIMEVNRAYGFIQKKQVSAFVEERHKNLNSGNVDYDQDTDPQQYDILNSENQFKPGPAPSDKFVDVNIKNAKLVQRITMQKLQEKVELLHQEIDMDFLQFVANNNGLKNDLFSFKDTIANYKKELSLAKSEDQQYQIVLRALQNTEQEIIYSGDKILIIHEMLNAPLAVLSGIRDVLKNIAGVLIAGSYQHLVKNANFGNFKHLNRCPSYEAFLNNKKREMREQLERNYIDGSSGEVAPLLTLLNLLVDISANKIPLIGISIAESGKVHLDFSKIGEFAKALIADLRSNLMKVKSMFTKRAEIEFFDRYESTRFDNSIRNIEELLVEVLINDRDENGLPTACSKYLNQTLEAYAKDAPKLCNSAMRALIYYEDRVGALPNVFTSANLSVFPFNVIALRRPAELKEDKVAISQISNSHYLDKKIASDLDKLNSNVDRLNSLLNAPCILFDSPNTLNTFNVGNTFVASYNPTLRHNPADDCIRPTSNKSLFFALNKFIHMYIQSNILNSPDPKIYAPLIEGFMNSAASREILEGKPFPNVRFLQTQSPSGSAPSFDIAHKYITSAPFDSFGGGSVKSSPCNLVEVSDPVRPFVPPAVPTGPLAPPVPTMPLPMPPGPVGPVGLAGLPKPGAVPVGPVVPVGLAGPPTGIPKPGAIPVAPPVPAALAGPAGPPGGLLAGLAGVKLNAPVRPPVLPGADFPLFKQAAVLDEKWKAKFDDSKTDKSLIEGLLRNVKNGNPIQSATSSSLLERFHGVKVPAALLPLLIKKGGAIGSKSGNILFSNDGQLVDVKKLNQNSDISFGAVPESPQENSLLYASTALTIKSLMYTMNLDKSKKRYLFDGLADIPAHLKEKMQINLPMFSKMFQSVIDRAAFLKRFLTYNKIGQNLEQREISETPIPFVDNDPNKQYAKLKQVSKFNNGQMRSYLLAMLTKLNDMALAAKKCCDGVYNELNDKMPYFMELRKDGVAEYKHRSGHYPFAPASFMLLPLSQANMAENDDYSGINGVMLPSNINGSYAYQLNNGLRVVYNNASAKFNIEHYPSVKEIYNAYLASFDIGKKISSSEYIAMLEKVTYGAKFLNELLQTQRLFCGENALRVKVLEDNAIPGTSSHLFNQVDLNRMTGAAFYPVLALRQSEDTINKLIELQDIVDHRIVKEEMLRFIGPPDPTGRPSRTTSDRSALRLFNILDLQVSPVNFSAFMREVPFTNLINYSYTFDRMTHDFILPDYLSSLGGPLTNDNVLIKPNIEAKTVKQVLIKFLLHPYAQFTDAEYLLLLFGVFGGMNDFGLGRPKFLNDQIFNKVLLTSPYNLLLNLLKQIQSNAIDVGNNYQVQGLKALASQIAAGIAPPASYDPMKNLYFPKDRGVSTVALDAAKQMQLVQVGRARFDTKLVRNVCWLVTLQLIMRHSITKHLSWIDTPVIRGLNLTDNRTTEYSADKNYDKSEYDNADYDSMLE